MGPHTGMRPRRKSPRSTRLGLESLESRRLLARADAYLAAVGETLEVAAEQGVLANDRAAGSPELSAILTSLPRHGTLQLSPDGSFRFQSDDAFVGTDSFQYQTDENGARSEPVQVTLQLLPQPVIINELLSGNTTGILTRTRPSVNDSFTGDPTRPDWIELRNLAARPLELGGYFLTDDPANLVKWQFPADTTIRAGGTRVVFASGRDLVDGALDEQGWLHTNFRLSSAGEFIALVNPQGQIVQQFAPQLPEQRNDVAFGYAGAELRYLTPPSPGRDNSVATALRGFLGEITPGVEHGFVGAPFQLTLAAADLNSTIRYTLDGSEPTADNGLEYTAPLTISQTTIVRARAFLPDFVPSPVMTQTYVFLPDVMRQSAQGEPPLGWPTTVNGQVLNYGMDPDIVDSPEWGPQLLEALTQIPSVSLVTDLRHLFDSTTGIYVNAERDGVDWERPTSVELIDPAGAAGFQLDAGLRIRGGFSRGSSNPKHSFRLFFRSKYAESQLDFPLFGSEGADHFQQVDLRTAQNNAWQFGTNRNSFLRDEFSRDTQRDMGQPYKRGRYYHLYLNGQYWGIYQTDERSEADYAATYFGGNEQDYDVIKANEGVTYATDGSLTKWNELWEIANRGFADNAAYFAVQGRNPDGTDNPQLERHVDVDNLIDYMLLVFYTGNTDGPTASFGVNNFYAIRNRQTRDGWQFLSHDAEHTLLSHITDNTRESKTGEQQQHFNPRWLHQRLVLNAEYRTRFADRVRQHLYPGGVLAPEQVAARIAARAAQIDRAIVAESARWGDVTRQAFTKQDWLTDVNYLYDTLVPQRTARVLKQMRDRGWYPAIEPPSFDPPSGQLSALADVQLSTAAGQVYYTLDGSDPRAIGGGISPSAQSVAEGERIVLAADARVHARALEGETWSALVSADYQVGPGAPPLPLRITEVHYHPADPTAAEVAAGFNDGDDFEFVELVNTSSQSINLAGARLVQQTLAGESQGVDFDFGGGAVLRLGPGQRVVVVEDPAAFRVRYGEDVPVAGQWSGGLSNAGEALTLQFQDQVLQSFTYHDHWYPATDGLGASLEYIASPQADNEHWNQAAYWRPSVLPGGTPGRPALLPGDVNGDLLFDSQDLILAVQAGQYEDATPRNSTFQSGDWNADGDFTTSDLVLAFQYGLFELTA